jgi:ATP-binding cassette, subfamily B, bacterial IrtB/YbtQ
MKANTRNWTVYNHNRGRLAGILGAHLLANIPRGAFHGFLYFIILQISLPVLNHASQDYPQLWSIYWGYVVCFILYLTLSAWSQTHNFVQAYTISTDIRLELGEKLRRLPLGYFKNHDPGDVTARMLHDVSKAEQTLSHALPDIATSVILPLLLGIFLITMNPLLGSIMIAIVAGSSVFFFIARKIIVVLGQQHISVINETSSRILEYSRCIKLLKAYNMTGESFATLDDSMRRLKRLSFRTEVFAGIPVQIFLLLIDGGYFLLAFIAVRMTLTGNLSIAVLFSFLVMGHYFFAPVKQLGINLVELRYALLSADRIAEVMNTPELPYSEETPLPDNTEITFSDVRFRYLDHDVLKGVSCRIPEQSMTALVGLSGSGKTTMTNLIARFWETTGGDIHLGDTSIKDLNPDILLTRISMVFQDVYLFNDTIAANIRVGKPDASDEEVQQAARKASCSDFIDALPNGYDTMVGESGGTLSGGEKQRISIARAILKDAPIVLLDEATASLDPENEAEIQTAIENLVRDKTIVVIAHRFKSIENADQILVVHEGKITETGIHDSLVTSGGLYQELWEKQQKAGSWKIREASMEGAIT